MKTKLSDFQNIIKSKGFEPVNDIDLKKQVVVGVLTTPRKKGIYPLPAGKDARLKIEMTAAARDKGIFMYFFYPESIGESRQTIIGHTYRPKRKGGGEWVRGVFPLPDIVYNRLSFRTDEAQKQVQQLLSQLKLNPSIHVFNSRFLHKWEVHISLSQNTLSMDLVPETCLFKEHNLYRMLSKYPELFIKPLNNSIGKGIIKVHRGSKHFDYKLAASDMDWSRCTSKKQLYSSLKSIIDGSDSQDKYLIQKGIDLAKFNGRIFDLRSQVQKNNQGKWVFTGVGVRVAARNKFVTHVPNGGYRASYSRVIKKVFGESPLMMQHLDQQLKYICQVVPYVLEKSLGMNLGILSIDIGIDKTGQMQIIEVNSKPASFDEDDIRKKHLDNLNGYFLYLSNSPKID
jgi:hypothetical protein